MGNQVDPAALQGISQGMPEIEISVASEKDSQYVSFLNDFDFLTYSFIIILFYFQQTCKTLHIP